MESCLCGRIFCKVAHMQGLVRYGKRLQRSECELMAKLIVVTHNAQNGFLHVTVILFLTKYSFRTIFLQFCILNVYKTIYSPACISALWKAEQHKFIDLKSTSIMITFYDCCEGGIMFI